jgi:hypothetical protein
LNYKDANGKYAKVNLSPQAIKIRTILQRKLDLLKEQVSEIKFNQYKLEESKISNKNEDQ